MKKLLTIAMMTAAVSALAVESSNTFGILKVTIPAGQKTVIVAAPWVDAGTTDGESIKVKDLIKTANLTVATKDQAGNSNADGDKIYVYNGTSYTAAFQLQDVDGVIKWNGLNMVVAGAQTEGGSDDTAITRGDAVILDMHTAPISSKDIYLYGQYKVSPASTTVSEGTNLIAAPLTEDLVLNNATWTGVAAGDMIYVRNTKAGSVSPIAILTYNNGTWGYRAKVDGVWTWCTDMSTIPAGEGFWYVRSKDAGQMTITWSSSN